MTRTVLVVDDDDSIRMVAEVALESVGGFGVLTADNGLSALDMAADYRPDAVLLDVMMPGMDGLTTFRHLQERASTRDIPVILVTAKVAVGGVADWDGLPIAGVIAKPFDPMTLSSEVAILLGWVA